VRQACDILRKVYDETEGVDGFVSLEVSLRIWRMNTQAVVGGKRVGCGAVWIGPNLFIKISRYLPPAYRRSRSCYFEGINVNITPAVLDCKLRGRRRGLHAGARATGCRETTARQHCIGGELLLKAGSTCSSISCCGSGSGRSDRRPTSPIPAILLGKAAIANAKLAYQSLKRMTGSDRWKALAGEGGARAAAAVGQHQHEGSRLPRSHVRRAADRPAHCQYHAGEDDRGVPRSRRRAEHPRARGGGGPARHGRPRAVGGAVSTWSPRSSRTMASRNSSIHSIR